MLELIEHEVSSQGSATAAGALLPICLKAKP
jgi:hypothetical protein